MAEMNEREFGNRYQLLQPLGRGGMGMVYRALDRLTGEYVALKYVLPASGGSTEEQSMPSLNHTMTVTFSGGNKLSLTPQNNSLLTSASHSDRLALAQEFRTLASLRHPNIISVLDYGFDSQQQPFFTMELLDHPKTVSEAGHDQPLAVQAGILAQLLRALSYLHRRGILHRDIKPSNVFYVDGEVKVLDFGIAVQSSLASGLAGTLEYMAPELLLGESASVGSDLYAVGVVMYQMMTGESPYTRDSITRLLAGKLGSADLTLPPHVMMMLEGAGLGSKLGDFTGQDWDDAAQEEAPPAPTFMVHGPLAPIIHKLLARDPAQRYQDAVSALRDISTALNEPLSIETAATRESFLQASQFVGREAELERLSSALQRATLGTGSSWLLGGESGVGKSRLLEEVRTLALVRGALVMRGQAVSSGSSAYQVWRDVLRMLCLHVELEDLEASVLKPLVPSLERMKGQPIPDAPELDAQATHQRMLTVVLDVFSRLKQPAMLILEDLHWAGAESLTLLQRLLESVESRPWLIIGSYRDDEMPALNSQLSAMQLLKLHRLGRSGIAALCEAMLGEVGRQPKLAKLLERETEGNVFFIIEVMRTLAAESGMLSEVGHGEIPQSVFAGGITAAIQRRLNRVPESAREMLRVAAIAGRQLDLNVLKAIEPDLDKWLNVCSEVAVLEVSDQQWRFSHDKLRETLLSEIAADESKKLHGVVADAMQTAYPQADQYAAALAYHYAQSGQQAKAADFSLLASEVSLRNGALTDAVSQLQQTKALQQKISTPVIKQAKVERLFVKALLGLGQLPECAEHFERAMELLGYPMPKEKLKLKLATMHEVGRQFLYRTKPERMAPPATAEERANLQELVELAEGCDVYAWLGYQDELGFVLLRLLNAAEAVDDVARRAWLYPFLGYAGSLTPISSLCDFYMRKTQEILPQVNHPRAENQYLRMRGIVELQAGQWEKAEQTYTRAVSLMRQIGDQGMMLFNLTQLVSVPLYAGDYQRSLAAADTLYDAAVQAHNTQFQVWALVFRSAIWNCLGDNAKSLAYAEEASRIPLSGRDNQAEMSNKGLLAVAAFRNGETARARQIADETLQLIAKTSVTGYGGLEGYGIAEIYAHLSKEAKNSPDREEAKQKFQLVLKKLGQYAAVIPLGKSPLRLWQGRWALMQGHPLMAVRHFLSSLQAAVQMKMPYDQAVAHYWLATVLKEGRVPNLAGLPAMVENHYRQHAEAALRLFTKLGVQPRIKEAQALTEPG